MSRHILRAFAELHPDSNKSLEDWYHAVKAADWANGAALRQTFNSADYVGNERFIFNIRGNHYRVVAAVVFSIRTVYIKFIGTHREYDGIDPATIEFVKS